MQASTQYYIGLFDVLIQRLLNTKRFDLLVIEFVVDRIFKNVHIMKVFNYYEIPVQEYLRLILAQLNDMHQLQKIAPNFEVKWKQNLTFTY